jgi:hypothetical protein
VLHCRLHEQSFGKGIDQRRRREPLLDVGFMREEFEVGEQNLDHAGAVDEIGDVGLGDRATDRLELPADQQILEVETEPDRLHTVLLVSKLGYREEGIADGKLRVSLHCVF